MRLLHQKIYALRTWVNLPHSREYNLLQSTDNLFASDNLLWSDVVYIVLRKAEDQIIYWKRIDLYHRIER